MAYSDVVLADAPAAYYRMDDAAGASAMADKSGNARNGSWWYAPTFQQPSLVGTDPNPAALFPGGYAYGNLQFPSWMNSQNLTCEAWVKTTTSGPACMLARTSATASQSVFRFGITGGGKLWFWEAAWGSTILSSASINDGKAHHVVATVAGTQVRLYVDGVLDTTGGLIEPVRLGGSTDAWIGAVHNSTQQYSGVLDELAYYTKALTPERVAAHYAAAQPPMAIKVPVGQVEETSEALPMVSAGAMAVQVGQVSESSEALPIGIVKTVVQPVTFRSGPGTLSVGAPERWAPAEMVLDVLDPSIGQAPTPIVAIIAEAWPLRIVDFYIDDVLVFTGMTDTYGGMAPTSINVPEALGAKGMHTLKAVQLEALDAEVEFEVRKDPTPALTTMGPDAQAVDIPGAIRPNGTRRWILQDLLPVSDGGIGSWVMPLNPKEMSSPHLERTFSTSHTTAVSSGQHHIMEGSARPVEWTFSGYAPTTEMHDKLLAYFDLNRRFYVIDHRKRAWKVAWQALELVPRLRESFGALGEPMQEVDGHDYTVTALVLDQDWVTPA